MKQIVLIIFLAMFALVAVAPVSADQTVTFQWDDANTPPPDGYRLFIRDASGTYDYTNPAYDGTAKTYQITLADGNYAAVIRSYFGTTESADSNEVIFTAEPQPPALIVPSRPKQLTIIFE